MNVIASDDSGSRWDVASRVTGAAGLASLVLLFGAQGLVQVGGMEPAFGAPASAISDFFAARDPALYAAGSYLSVLGLLAFVWFIGGVWALLRGVEGEPPWRSTVAVLSGGLYVAIGASGGWDLAQFRWPEGVDPQIARLAFDLGNLSFASAWVALGTFALATGWVIVSSSGAQPRWLGWLAVVAGVGLVAARAVWTTPFWFFPYALFWVWVIVVSVRLIRRPFAPRLPAPAPAAGRPRASAT